MAKNVLIVDDCDATRRILMRGVREAAGTSAEPASAGDLRENRTFDLILCDVAADANGAKLAPGTIRAIFGPFLK